MFTSIKSGFFAKTSFTACSKLSNLIIFIILMSAPDNAIFGRSLPKCLIAILDASINLAFAISEEILEFIKYLAVF